MTVLTIPDAEQIVGKLLREHPDVMAINARVASRLPTSFKTPWVRVTQLDAINVTNGPVEYLIEFFLQFDCYAGEGNQNPQLEASSLSRIVRAVLHGMPQADIQDVVVTQVIFTSHARIPDESMEPARERYVLDAEVRLHLA
jgi:hypothetical protein